MVISRYGESGTMVNRCRVRCPGFKAMTEGKLILVTGATGYAITKRPLRRALCNKIVATALCAILRPQDGGYDYGLVVVVVVSVSFFS